MIRRLLLGVFATITIGAWGYAVDPADLAPITPPPATTQPAVSWLPPEYLAAMEHANLRGLAVWDRLADCESGEWNRHRQPIRGTANWQSTKGFYEGGLQFAHSTWVAAGGRKYAEHAYQATRTEQIDIADGWLARTSWAQWPVCSRKVGLR